MSGEQNTAARCLTPASLGQFWLMFMLAFLGGCRPPVVNDNSVPGVFSKIPIRKVGQAYSNKFQSMVLAISAQNEKAILGLNTPRKQIILSDNETKETSVVYEITDASHLWSITSLLIDGDIVAWDEYYQIGDSVWTFWQLCWMSTTEKVKRILSDNKSTSSIQPPNISVSHGVIAYDHWTGETDTTGNYEIKLYDTNAMKELAVISSEGFNNMWPALSADKLVYCRTSSSENKALTSELMLYNLAGSDPIPLGIGSSCVEPAISGSKVVYNEAPSFFSMGVIWEYDLDTKEKTRIWPTAQNAWLQTDTYGGIDPTINSSFVTWVSLWPYLIYFDLSTRELGRLASEGNTVILGQQACPQNIIWISQGEDPLTFIAEGIRFDSPGNNP